MTRLVPVPSKDVIDVLEKALNAYLGVYMDTAARPNETQAHYEEARTFVNSLTVGSPTS